MNGNFCTVEMMIFLPLLDELAQVAGVVRVAHRRADLHELLDGFLDLVVQDAPVGDHDDGIENLRVLALQRRLAGGPARRWSCYLPLPAECWIR